MSEKNGWHQLPKPTLKPGGWNNSGKPEPLMPQPPRVLVTLPSGATLLVLAAVLTGCAGLSTPPSEGPRNPQMPPPAWSQPTEPYLSRVLRNIELWEKKLQDTLAIP